MSSPARKEPRDPRLGLTVGRVFGVPIYVQPSLLLLGALLVYLYGGALASGRDRYFIAAVFVVLLYASVLVHELSHVAVARAFRLPVRRVLLYPLGGFSEITEEPPTPLRESLVSAAGPAMSLALAAVAWVLVQLFPGGTAGLIIDQVFRANLVVGIFNLLPGLPLDGGRILRAGLWKLTGRPSTATIAAAWGGRILAGALAVTALVYVGRQQNGLAGSPYWLWLAFLAAFMWMQSSMAIRSAKARERLPSLRARALARRAIPIPGNIPLSEAIRRADEAQARALVVVDGAARPVAIVNEGAVMATPEQQRPWVSVGSLARGLETGMVLSADLSGLALLDAVRRTPASEYLIVESSGQVYGVLAAADLNHAFAGA